MEDRRIRALLVEDNPAEARLVQETVSEIGSLRILIEHVPTLQEALDLLGSHHYDIALLDMNLPDSRGLETLARFKPRAEEIAIVILTNLNDESFGLAAVQEGAQEYVIKQHVNPTMLSRIIRYSIERQHLLTQIRKISLLDELTGIYNRRGFVGVLQQMMRDATRSGSQLLLFYLDLDLLKRINDELGHAVGDQALCEVADLLRETFRQPDVIGRLGGDEFAALAVERQNGTADLLLARLEENLRGRNRRADRRYELSVSAGVTRFNPASPLPVEQLLVKADAAMYEIKRGKRPT